ncbi:conserved hypothetical protein [Tenacibaculum sediminilitoris]
MKLKRNYKIFISLLIIIISWLMIGIGYTSKYGSIINTVLFFGGIIFSFFGFIMFLLSVNIKN